MPKQNDYTLTTEELDQISAGMKSRQARVAKRASVIHSLYLGYVPQEVATIHQVSLASVYNHFNPSKLKGWWD